MYGFHGGIYQKQKALAPVNARRVFEAGWYLNTVWEYVFIHTQMKLSFIWMVVPRPHVDNVAYNTEMG